MCKRVIMFEEPEFMNETPYPLADQIKQKLQAQEKASVNYFYGLIQKQLKDQEITDIQLQKLNQQQRTVFQAISERYKSKTKRPDQCYKLFYKRAFKYSEKKFFKKKKNHSRIMSQFYHHHFDEITQTTNIPITNFYHPNKKSRPGFAIKHKTFNLSYVRLLLRSDSFRADAKQYCHDFFKECKKDKDKKIKSFISVLTSKMKRGGGEKELMLYLQSSQCKIPWTQDEIQKAELSARKELEKWGQMDVVLDENEMERVKEIEEEQMYSQEEELDESLMGGMELQLPDIL